jgi:hypothetical protein
MPPREDEIFARARSLIESESGLIGTTPESLAGIAGNVTLLREIAAVRNGDRLNSDCWPLWKGLGLEHLLSYHHERTSVLLLPRAIGNYGITRRVGDAFAEACAHANRLGVLIMTVAPHSRIWDDGPEKVLRVICPSRPALSHVSGARARARLAGMSVVLDDDIMTQPVSASALIVGVGTHSRVIGWAEDNKIWLRFHPFLASTGRLSAADLTRRINLLKAVFDLAAPHLQAPNAHQNEVVSAWLSAIRQAESTISLAALTAATAPIDENGIRSRLANARFRTIELEQELEDARARALSAETEALAIPTLLRARNKQIKNALLSVEEQLEGVRALAQVQTAHLITLNQNLSLCVKTHPLVLDCAAAGLREVGPLSFSLPIGRSGDPLFEAPHLHPALNDDGGFDWTTISLPLAQAIGSGDLKAAVAAVCGVLARPLELTTSSLPLPVSTQRGYIAEDIQSQ